MTPSWDAVAGTALADELARWEATGRLASVWWRDDDAGPPDPALERLLRLAAALSLPLGVAVVPAWLEPATAALLQAASPAVAILQHGFAHANHEAAPRPGPDKLRPAECGAARPTFTVLAELAEGRARLAATFGARALPLLVPPWNRVAPGVRLGLPALGYRALSTFGPRTPTAGSPGLIQLPCHADPILWRSGKRFAGAAATLERLRAHLAARRTGRADPGEPTGLLTHHRDMDPAGWGFLDELLPRLVEHPAVTLPSVSLFIGHAPWTPLAGVC